jgi:hypothetical protein
MATHSPASSSRSETIQESVFMFISDTNYSGFGLLIVLIYLDKYDTSYLDRNSPELQTIGDL